eukprot:1660895-Alexandrium_andersonii.AAC.1
MNSRTVSQRLPRPTTRRRPWHRHARKRAEANRPFSLSARLEPPQQWWMRIERSGKCNWPLRNDAT